MLGYLPAKFTIRFLEPIPTDRWGERPVGRRGARADVAARGPRRIQESLFDMLGKRAERVVRMSSKRILITGLSTYWGGRLAQALERDPAVEAIIGVDRRGPDASSSSAPSSCASATSTR